MSSINDYIDQLVNLEKRRKPLWLIPAILVIGLAVFLLAFPKGDSTTITMAFFYFIICFLFFIGLVTSLKLILPVDQFPPSLVKILRTDPEKIVWIYIVNKTQAGQYIETNLMFATIDRKRIQGPCPGTSKDNLTIMNEIAQLFPKAVLGYNSDYETAFRQDPKLLIK